MITTNDNAPLSGIRVLDFSHAASGPLATLYMADLGAEVIKVERPVVGDSSRHYGLPMFGPLDTDYQMAMNRTKQSIVIDLSSGAGVRVACELVAESDVVVQNYRPGVAEKLRVDFEAVRKLRDGLVYCSISGFGDGGPLGGRPANDIIMQAVSGMMGVTGESDGPPVRMGAPIADFSTGLFALVGILAALQCRSHHPEGQHVRVTMLESSLAMMANFVPRILDLGQGVPRLGRAHPQIVPYDAFLCADEKWLLVGAFTDKFWRSTCDAVERPELIADPEFRTNQDRLENRERLTKILVERFKSKTLAEWCERLDAVGVPNSGVNQLEQTVRSEQIRHLGALLHLESDRGELDLVDLPPKCSAWDRPKPEWPATLGEHSESVLRRVLGYDDRQVRELFESDVVV